MCAAATTAKRGIDMKPDETVKTLKWLAEDTEFVFAGEALDAAADLIESLQAEVGSKDAEIARLTKALHKADIDCDHCKHNHGGECENADFDCMTCDCDCICKSCRDNSNWEWCGATTDN